MANQVIYVTNLTNAAYVGNGDGIILPRGLSNVQTFTGSGTTPAPFTWVKPSTGSWIRVECWGAGGAACGGGGAFTSITIPVGAVPGSTVAVVAGGGGLFPTGPGANSTFGPYGPGGTITGFGGNASPTSPTLSGGGGGGAERAATSTGGNPGGGDRDSNGILFGGGGGSKTASGGSSVYGGGGGGVTGGTSVFGGAGGSGAVPGVIPGGGGGLTANGAAGQVRVFVF